MNEKHTRTATFGTQTWVFNTREGLASLMDPNEKIVGGEVITTRLPKDDAIWVVNTATGHGQLQPLNGTTNRENDMTQTTRTPNGNRTNRNGRYRTRLANWCHRQLGKRPILGALGVIGGLMFLAKLIFIDLLGDMFSDSGWVIDNVLVGIISMKGMMFVVIVGLVIYITWDKRRAAANARPHTHR